MQDYSVADPAARHEQAYRMTDNAVLEESKRFVNKHFERLLVVFLVASLLLIQYFIEYKFAFLSFYYLPIILAGFYGKDL